MIIRISTKDMSQEQWLEERRKSIGGSDAGAILGLNSYTSPYALWCEKTGKIVPEDISDKEAVRLGNDLEQYVAERWMEKTGKKVRRDNNMIYNKDYPFAHANIDRSVIGESAGLECKTTSSLDVLQQCREGKFPDTWYCQMTHYMMVTGADRWYLGVLVFGKGFFEFTVERDEAEIAALMTAEAEFWELVKTDTPPAVDGTAATSKALNTIYSESDDSVCDLTAFSTSLHQYIALKKQIKELEELADEAANKVKDLMVLT